MVLALFADVHANLEALEACLADARERRASRFAFLGDLAGYGPDPGAVIDIVAGHVGRGAVAVKGNHDAAIAGATEYLNDSAAAAIAWQRGVLSRAQRAFLDDMPLVVREEGICFVHASAVAPERWDYVDSAAEAERSARAAGTPRTFCGHVHRQMLYISGAAERMVAFAPTPGVPIPMRAHRTALALAGSVGQPRDGNSAAAYAIADFETRMLTFHRVAYDNHATARKIRRSGLPEVLAYRLERGI